MTYTPRGPVPEWGHCLWDTIVTLRRDNAPEQVLLRQAEPFDFRGQFAHFIKCIQTGQPPLTDAESAREVIRLVRQAECENLTNTKTYKLKACPVRHRAGTRRECFFGRNDTTLYDLAFYVWVVRGPGVVGLIDAGLPEEPRDLATLNAANQTVDKRCVYRDVVTLDVLLRREKLRPGRRLILSPSLSRSRITRVRCWRNIFHVPRFTYRAPVAVAVAAG